MQTKTFRLDRFIAKTQNLPLKAVQLVLAGGSVMVNGMVARDMAQVIGPFDRVTVNGLCLQDRKALYLMVHKPKGVVCATKDAQHTTVLDLIDHPQKAELHIAGRLDRNSTGLVLLSNDGRWSKKLTEPASHVKKLYRVTVKYRLTPAYVEAFAQGMFFNYENQFIRPVKLTIVSSNTAIVELTEGRYHQIKRMFGRFRNPVLALHRYQIGPYSLDEGLPEQSFRPIQPELIESN